MSNEVWRDVEGTGYKVSSLGRVMGPKDNILKQQKTTGGYRFVLIKGRTSYVHRLVATAFIGPSDKQVDHIDNDPGNNCVDNLRWVAPRENIKRSFEKPRGKSNGNVGRPVRMVSEDFTVEFSSMAAAARAVGRATTRIFDAVKRGTNCAGGRWYRAEGF